SLRAEPADANGIASSLALRRAFHASAPPPRSSRRSTARADRRARPRCSRSARSPSRTCRVRSPWAPPTRTSWSPPHPTAATCRTVRTRRRHARGTRTPSSPPCRPSRPRDDPPRRQAFPPRTSSASSTPPTVSLPFVEPGHLDRLQDLLVRLVGIVGEARQLPHPLVQIGEADGERIRVRELLVQRDADLLDVVPGQLLGHVRSSLGGPGSSGLRLVALLGVLVVPRLLGLFGDLVDDVLLVELRLAAEPRVGLHVVRPIELVGLAVLHVGERLESLLHPDVAGRAGADSAAGGAVLGAEVQRGLEQRPPFRDFAFRFQLAARIVDGDLRHHFTGSSTSRRAE